MAGEGTKSRFNFKLNYWRVCESWIWLTEERVAIDCADSTSHLVMIIWSWSYYVEEYRDYACMFKVDIWLRLYKYCGHKKIISAQYPLLALDNRFCIVILFYRGIGRRANSTKIRNAGCTIVRGLMEEQFNSEDLAHLMSHKMTTANDFYDRLNRQGKKARISNIAYKCLTKQPISQEELEANDAGNCF